MRSCFCVTCSNSGGGVGEPFGGALRSNPIMATGLCRIGYAANHIFGGGHRALGHATSGPCLQQNLVCILEGRS